MALESIQSKLRYCDSSLADIEVNIKELLRHLLQWFEHKPLIEEDTVLSILLAFLKVSRCTLE